MATAVLTVFPNHTPFQFTAFVLKVDISPRKRDTLNDGETEKKVREKKTLRYGHIAKARKRRPFSRIPGDHSGYSPSELPR